MKTLADPRHKAREDLVQLLFASSFRKKPSASAKLAPLLKKLPEIDQLITKAAPEWPIDNIGKIDLAILRLSVYELLTAQEPPKVVIDEAVELAKAFGGEGSAPFVNGALGTVFAWLSKKK